MSQTQVVFSEEDLELQNELVSSPMFKLHKVKKEDKTSSLNLEYDAPKPDYSLCALLQEDNVDETIFKYNLAKEQEAAKFDYV